MLNGAVFALWPVMWIVVNALLLYNIAVRSGRFDAFRSWMITHLPNDRRVVLVVVGFCFGALLEGIAGFGTPVAIASSLLILVGFPALEALVFVLIFNTAPVAFGALGTGNGARRRDGPAGAGAGGDDRTAIALHRGDPAFLCQALYGGWRSVRALWPVLLVAGCSSPSAVSGVQFHRLHPHRRALLARSLVVTLLFCGSGARPRTPSSDRGRSASLASERPARRAAWQGWLPWLIVTAVVILWTSFGVAASGSGTSRGRDSTRRSRSRSITTSRMRRSGLPAARHRNRDPVAAVITALFVDCRRRVPELRGQTIRQVWLAVITVMLIVALAYLMNYSGLAYTLGQEAASTGHLFVLFSPFLGWMAVMLSGSDTSGNALFGNLQVVAARQLNLNPVLFAATNSSGGVMGKMISPQNIATGVSVTS